MNKILNVAVYGGLAKQGWVTGFAREPEVRQALFVDHLAELELAARREGAFHALIVRWEQENGHNGQQDVTDAMDFCHAHPDVVRAIIVQFPTTTEAARVAEMYPSMDILHMVVGGPRVVIAKIFAVVPDRFIRTAA